MTAGAGNWKARTLRGLCSGLLYLFLPLALLRLYWRGRRDAGHRQRWRERLGLLPALPSGCHHGYMPFQWVKPARPYL